MNWYKIALNNFNRGDKIVVIRKKPNPLLVEDLSEMKYFVDEDDKNFYLSKYPPTFNQHSGSSWAYDKFYYNIEKI